MRHLTASWASLQVRANNSESYAKQVAQMMRPSTGLKYPGLAGLVAEYGRPYKSVDLPPGVDRGQMGDCFMNAGRIASMTSSLTYVEGYAAAGFGFPLHHAWLTSDGTDAIDPTWPKGTDYFGIPITASFLRRAIQRTGYWGVFGQNDWPDDTEQEWYEKGLPSGAVAR